MAKSVSKIVLRPEGETAMVAKAGDFEMVMDKAEKGVSPGSALLGSLAGCKGMVLQAVAKMRKVDIKDFRIEIEGEVDTSVAKGYHKITTHFFIETDDLEGEELEKFVQLVEDACFVNSTLKEPAEFITKIN